MDKNETTIWRWKFFAFEYKKINSNVVLNGSQTQSKRVGDRTTEERDIEIKEKGNTERRDHSDD